jgi:hypothetical protein
VICSKLLTLRIPDGSYSIKASRIRFLCFCILVLGRHTKEVFNRERPWHSPNALPTMVHSFDFHIIIWHPPFPESTSYPWPPPRTISWLIKSMCSISLRIPDGSYSIKASRIRFLCFCILVLGRHLNTDILLMQLSKHYNILHNDLINQDIVRGGIDWLIDWLIDWWPYGKYFMNIQDENKFKIFKNL